MVIDSLRTLPPLVVFYFHRGILAHYANERLIQVIIEDGPTHGYMSDRVPCIGSIVAAGNQACMVVNYSITERTSPDREIEVRLLVRPLGKIVAEPNWRTYFPSEAVKAIEMHCPAVYIPPLPPPPNPFYLTACPSCFAVIDLHLCTIPAVPYADLPPCPVCHGRITSCNPVLQTFLDSV